MLGNLSMCTPVYVGKMNTENNFRGVCMECVVFFTKCFYTKVMIKRTTVYDSFSCVQIYKNRYKSYLNRTNFREAAKMDISRELFTVLNWTLHEKTFRSYVRKEKLTDRFYCVKKKYFLNSERYYLFVRHICKACSTQTPRCATKINNKTHGFLAIKYLCLCLVCLA